MVSKKTLVVGLILVGILLLGAYRMGRWAAGRDGAGRLQALESEHVRAIAALQSALEDSQRYGDEASRRVDSLNQRIAELEESAARDAARFGAALAGVTRIEDSLRRATDDNIAIGTDIGELEKLLAEIERREQAANGAAQ